MNGIRKLSLIALAMTALFCAGCPPSAKDKLVGKWQGGVQFDEAAVEQRLTEAGNNPIACAIATKAMEGVRIRIAVD